MRISELRETVRSTTVEFAWDQWAQMGVFARTARRDQWAQDPEALVLFTLEVARNDARLFDETLDWLRLNIRLLSAQRLRNLCHDDQDRALAGAALDWVDRSRRTSLLRPAGVKGPEAPVLLFPGLSAEIAAPDEAFLAYGLLRSAAQPSFKSGRPELSAPINFAFRLRRLFGVGSRAEVMRYLLTVPAPDVNANLVAAVAAYAKRNVNETLASLVASGAVHAFSRANERRYYVERERWASLLQLDREGFPAYREWSALLRGLRAAARWLEDPRLDELSDYLVASEARRLMDRIGGALHLAGVPVARIHRVGSEYWQTFVETVTAALDMLTPDRAN